jgi:tetratricopeptide (TPR) repeat protein
LNPNLPQSHIRYSAYLLLMKRYDEAVAEAKRTRELDPLTLVVKWSVADFLYAARRYDEAGEEFRKTLELNPDSAHGHYRLGDFYMAKGRYSEAIAAYRESVSLSGGRYETSLANALARSGEHAKAEEILRRVDLKTVDWYGLPVLYASLNKRDEAFALLEKAFSERYPNLPYVSADPMYDSLRSDPRFQDLLRRIRLPQ